MFTRFLNKDLSRKFRTESQHQAHKQKKQTHSAVQVIFFAIFCALSSLPQFTHANESIIAENSGAADNLKSEEKAIRENMVLISRQLGVTCLTCHNTDNFKSDKKHEFQVAREHMKLTQMLIDNGMDGKKSYKADCNLCHRGVLKPVIQEPKPAK